MSGLDLGVVGNSHVAALINQLGRIVWYCLPRLDGDPVFCSLLKNDPEGRDQGFADVVVEDFASATQGYQRNSAILTTTLTDQRGSSVQITDFAPRFKQYDRIFRPGMLIRRIEPLTGACRIRIRMRPLFENGSVTPTRTLGSNHIRYVSPITALRLTTDAPISYVNTEAVFPLTRPVILILGPDEALADSIQRVAREFQERTNDYWLDWVRYLSVPFEWQEAVIRAAITLKLCSFEETGAVVAALTTSIPEAPQTSRNWDYRYCWLRDAYFVVQALNRLGATRTMEGFLDYITTVSAREANGHLKPVYSIVPDLPLEEIEVPSLPGYRGFGPVRIGNRAVEQNQHDSYGSVVLAAAQMFFDRRLPRQGDVALFERLERLGEKAQALAFEPDAGLWEFRTRSRIHTHSAVLCWAACDRLAKIATVLGLDSRAEAWRKSAKDLRNRILEGAWNADRNSFVASLGGTELDASLLLMQEVGIVAANDPRFVSTVDAITKDLRRGHQLFRYSNEDDFGVPTTAFNLCTFWYIDALVAIGRADEARELFQEMLSRRNHVGLLSEDLDPVSGELWGNFPQTYSMVGIIVSAMRLSKSWEAAFWRGW
ncbi:MAG TPA: glycoside hydrolase family 15 protein [Verrucomicrobiae bacterium]|nr:glycoside hydrolase family 15 protein [Verrucomicrobiae bacterium]